MLLSFATNPVAAANSCVVASSFVSVATFKSRNPTTTAINCATRTVSDWRNACIADPQMACAKPQVKDTFGDQKSSSYNKKTLREVLCDSSGMPSGGELGVLQHLIALRLCLTQGFMRLPQGNVSPAYLNGIWDNYWKNGKRYRLTASGIDWSSDQLVSWLRYQLNYPMPL